MMMTMMVTCGRSKTSFDTSSRRLDLAYKSEVSPALHGRSIMIFKLMHRHPADTMLTWVHGCRDQVQIPVEIQSNLHCCTARCSYRIRLSRGPGDSNAQTSYCCSTQVVL
nr:hypothetical protein CFP56_13018 [Quercus suber]